MKERRREAEEGQYDVELRWAACSPTRAPYKGCYRLRKLLLSISVCGLHRMYLVSSMVKMLKHKHLTRLGVDYSGWPEVLECTLEANFL